MPLSGLYVRFSDVNRRKDYPNFVLHDGYYYETKVHSLTASSNTTPIDSLSTLTRDTSTFNTLEGLVVSIATEDSRLVPRPIAIYAYYDI